ncbi:uncharacterized protein LOC131649997 [Vicia villosa]|uniref:uncharacterized protein LOC131649997 n=1 Tax=Vicia villosa TaxID=3911 RepID=UPI00273A8F7B|nr:uncharacterized protein LOC131649997 [Vicia villosa]
MEHDGLLTNQKKARMGLGSAMCRRCGNIEEDTLHVLRDCPSINKLWNAANLANNNMLFFAGNLQDWIHLNLEHDGNYNTPVDDYGFIMRQIHQYKEAKRTHVVATAPNMEEKMIKWDKPLRSWIKINVDGAASHYGLQIRISMGFKQIIIESDSKQIVKDIISNIDSTTSGNLLYKIKKLLLAEVEVSFKHIFREANRCVDELTKH